jgi:soluble lytic murein transglycosylase
LDAAWVLGLMRSESAMAVDAISPADARGLMQVLPGTAAQLAKRYSYPYHGTEQLMKPEDNIVFGTTFLRELMDRFDDNPVLVTGAYNAGPGAVKRWLETLPTSDTAIWVEVLPYFETRDYIPRVSHLTISTAPGGPVIHLDADAGARCTSARCFAQHHCGQCPAPLAGPA